MSEKTRRTVAWLIGSLAAVALVVLALNIEKFAPKPAAPVPPVHVASFDDGGSLEILGVSLGQREIEVAQGRRFRMFTQRGSTGSYYGGLRIDTEEENGEVIRCRVHADTSHAMLVEFRLKDAYGQGGTFTHYLTQRNMVEADVRLAPSGPRSFIEAKDDSIAALHAEMTRAGLPFLLQHRDPKSGWIHLMGPGMFHEPWPDRFIATLENWDRSLPTLEFRAIRQDGGTVEFSLPNPDHHTKPKPIKPAALPIVHHGTEFTLTVRGVERFAVPGSHPFAALDFDLAYTGTPVRGLEKGPIALHGAPSGVSDEWGNVTQLDSHSIEGRSRRGAFLPAGSGRMSLALRVGRDDSYPRRVDEGFVVLVGKVSADGKSVDFQPGPDAALFGVTQMPVGRIEPEHARHRPGAGGWMWMKADVEGKGDDFESIRTRIGEIGRWRTPLFPGDSDISAGITDFGASGSAGWGGSEFHFNRRVYWLLPPELLEPGDTFRLGVVEMMEPEELTLDLELPPEIHEP